MPPLLLCDASRPDAPCSNGREPHLQMHPHSPGSRSGPAASAAAGTGCWPAGRSAIRRRSRITPATGPRRSSTADLAWIAGSRWHIEECIQQAKGEAGLDHYQVRSWRAWYAHIPLSMLALAWLGLAAWRSSGIPWYQQHA